MSAPEKSPPTGAAAGDPSPPVPGGAVSDSYRRYALGLLVVVYVFNFIDRQILSILAEAIRVDLGLTDTQLGFLGGVAFAVFYTFAGIPIARWADRGVRRSIIALGLFVWSGMTAVTGLANNFLQLSLARIGVGLGEAACSPPAHSMLSDYFPPEQRGRAFGIYSLGIPIGSAIGILAGGWIKEIFDWRTAFYVVGLPGIVLAVIVRWTLREPQRGYWEGRSASDPIPDSVPIPEVLRYLWKRRSFRHLSLAAALHAFYGYGASLFLPVFMIRVHGMGEGELSLYLAAVVLAGSAVGTYLGGSLGDRLGPRDRRWYMWVPGISTAVGIPFACFVYLWPEGRQALIYAGIPATLLGAMYLGPTFAMAQGLARADMRAMVSALLLFVINLIGLGLGPQAVGLLSDLLKPTYGVDSIRYALLWVVVVGAVWASFHYYMAARTLREDLEGRLT